jgi:hypothetical protein
MPKKPTPMEKLQYAKELLRQLPISEQKKAFKAVTEELARRKAAKG